MTQARSPSTSLRANGSRECAPDDRLREAIQLVACSPDERSDIRGGVRVVPDLEKYLVRDSGHWTQQEKPDEVSAKLIEWRRKRFG